MAHETELAALPGDGGFELVDFPFMEVVPCPDTCAQGSGEGQHPERVYIHLRGSLVAFSSCEWCIPDQCVWCHLDPFTPDDPDSDPPFKNGVIQMVQVGYYPGTNKCTCDDGSTSACCWCMGGYEGDDDIFERRPSGCNGVNDQGQATVEEGVLYQGGAFCTDIFGLPVWFIWIGVATCPSQCGQNAFEGCGPDCGLIDPAQVPCQCITGLAAPGSVSFSAVYYKPNFSLPGSYPDGTLLGEYAKLYANMPDEDGLMCGSFVAAPESLIVTTDPNPLPGP